ncbi:hypothetical protein PV326_009958 [Microctonus aethiopoides]|nr:hypothetical protein PV326_009958 [Microctonus aethiopoides]
MKMSINYALGPKNDLKLWTHLHWSNHRVDSLDSATAGGGGGGGGGLGWPRSSRPRINSAIDVAGFLSQEFLRRHGSTSRLCRKVRSADNLPLASCNNRQNDDHRNSNDDGVEMDREIFFPTPNDEEDKTDDTESKRQSSLESGGNKDNAEISLLEPYLQQSTAPKECISTATITNASPGLVTKRLGGWKVGGSHEYVKCPIRQSSVIDERFHRHSCEPDFTRPQQHHHRRMSPVGHLFHHQSTESETHSRNRDFSKRTMGASVETQHFGLPILSISEPSPPDERDRLDDYL